MQLTQSGEIDQSARVCAGIHECTWRHIFIVGARPCVSAEVVTVARLRIPHLRTRVEADPAPCPLLTRFFAAQQPTHSLSAVVHFPRPCSESPVDGFLPREQVVQLLADPAHLPKWPRGLVLHEPVSGTHGQVGTRSRVVMQMGKQKVECIETITRREPVDLHEIPRGSAVLFDREIVGEGMWSAVRDRLTESGLQTTLWQCENEYRFSGLLMRLVGFLMPGAFRKQSQQHMQDFKAFAERGKDVRDAKG